METHFENIQSAHSQLARERLLTDLRTLSHDAEDLLKATASDVSDKAKEARSRLTEALERTKATCKEMEERTIANAKAAVKQADTVIRHHPYESIGVAFGIGMLIGVLITRK